MVTYGYDAADRLTSISQGASSVAIAYDDANRRTGVTLPDSIAEQYGYDTADRLTGITYKLGASTLGDLNYGYDVAGQRNAVWGTYARTGLPAAKTYTYNAANQLTKVGTTSTTNDLNGSLTNDSVSSFTWNNRGQLATSSKTGLSASYAYDAYGRRKSKTAGATSTNFLYDGANAVQELSGSTPTANLLDGPRLDEIYSRSDATGTKSFLTDALGSTLALADTSGTVSTSYTYEPFGNATSTGAASTNSFQYTGRESDGTGLAYLRARYYSPGLQRFLSEDLIDTPSSSFAYARDLPTMLTDRTGLCWTGFCWAEHTGSWAIHHPDIVVDAVAAGCVVATATACTPLAITALGTTTVTSAYKNGIIGGRKTNYGRFAGDLTFTGLTFGAGSLWGAVARNEYYVVSAGDRSALTRLGAGAFFLGDTLIQGARGELGR